MPTLRELLTRPFAGVAVALDLRDAIALQQVTEFLDHSLGGERRPDLAHAIEHGDLAFRVGDGKREAVGAAAARIDEGNVALAAEGFAFVNAPVGRSLDRLSTDERFNIGAELSAEFGGGRDRVLLVLGVDVGLGHASGSSRGLRPARPAGRPGARSGGDSSPTGHLFASRGD